MISSLCHLGFLINYGWGAKPIIGRDDRLYANMICGTSTLTFTNEGELDNLVSGTGSFDTVARTIKFRLITRPGSGPELDTLDYVLRRPD